MRSRVILIEKFYRNNMRGNGSYKITASTEENYINAIARYNKDVLISVAGQADDRVYGVHGSDLPVAPRSNVILFDGYAGG